MKRAGLVYFLMMTSVAGNNAASEMNSNERVMEGIGVFKCTELEELYRMDPKLTERLMDVWTKGFFSGINMSMMIDIKAYYDLKDIDYKETWSEMLSHCKYNAFAHPIDVLLYKIKKLELRLVPQDSE